MFQWLTPGARVHDGGAGICLSRRGTGEEHNGKCSLKGRTVGGLCRPRTRAKRGQPWNIVRGVSHIAPPPRLPHCWRPAG